MVQVARTLPSIVIDADKQGRYNSSFSATRAREELHYSAKCGLGASWSQSFQEKAARAVGAKKKKRDNSETADITIMLFLY